MLFPQLKHSKKVFKKRKQRQLSMQTLENRRVMAAAILNEVNVNPGGADQPFEYVEVKGVPGSSTDNLYFVAFESDGNAGLADLVIPLGGRTFGSNGLLAIVASGGGHFVPSQTTMVLTEAFNVGTTQTLENNSTTFALISSPEPIVQGQDYELIIDGILELPAGATMLDSFGFTDGGAGDVIYGPTVVVNAASPSATPPSAATRFRNDNRPMSADAWYAGDLPSPNNTTVYSTAPGRFTANLPAGAAITPGAPNAPGTNLAPVANADAYSVEPGAVLSVARGAGVLSNDVDGDGPLSLLTAVLVTPPSLGSLVFNGDGSFTYTSDGTPGIDTFSYFASDLEVNTAPITVTLNVEVNTNTPPSLTLSASGVLNHDENVATILAPAAVVADSDSPDFGTGALTVAIIDGAQADDQIAIRNQGNGAGQIGVSGANVTYEGQPIGGINGGSGTAPLLINLNGNATLAAVNALVQNITFTTLSDDPVATPRTISFNVTDGDGGTSGTPTVVIGVTPVNDAPTASVVVPAVNYATGDAGVSVAGSFALSDPDSPTFNNAVLTASIASGIQTGDALGIRNVGTGAGQVAVSGNTVRFGGVVVGTATGLGTGSITVTLNASSSLDAAQAIARSVTFVTTQTRVLPSRTVDFAISDGVSAVASAGSVTVTQSIVKKYAFQQNVDTGLGLYTSVSDTEMRQSLPDDANTAGANPLEGLLVDWDGGTANSQVLMRFDDLFGTGVGQIPVGAQIVSARLVVQTNNPGDGGTFHRLLQPFTEAATWNNTGGGIQTDGIEARTVNESQIGVAAGNSDAATGTTVVGVTRDIQAWANGETNHGWVIQGHLNRGDGWAFTSSEATEAASRPRLEVEWLPASVASTTFQTGVDGYVGTTDATLTEQTPDADASTGDTVFVDFTTLDAFNTAVGVLKFADILGSATSQIPAGSVIQAATLDLTSITSNAQGNGGTFHRLLSDLPNPLTWAGFGDGVNGIQPDGIIAEATANTVAGNPPGGLRAEAGFNTFDVTTDVQAWINGSAANNGWAILPHPLGTDGWGFSSSEATDVAVRPRLRVFFTAPSILVTPTTGLVTSESGQTATFSVVLATPPTADVTIPLSSSDTTEGTLSVASVTFTPTNWDVPQVVTVTGVADTLADGDVAYNITTGPATSLDAFYAGLDADDVSATNLDVVAGVAPRVQSVVFGDGTAQRSMVRQITVTFDSKVTASASSFVLERRVGGAFVAIPAAELTIGYADIGDANRTIARLTFTGTGIAGGSLSDGNYRLTLRANQISLGGLSLDGNGDGTGGDDFVRGSVEADAFFRLFGDTNGNRTTTLAELGQVRASVNRPSSGAGYNPLFDANNNGVVSLAESGQVRARINRRLNF